MSDARKRELRRGGRNQSPRVLANRVVRINEEISVRLKWGQTEYEGRLVSIDSYMNIQLAGAKEYIDQKMTSELGQVLIRYVCFRASPQLACASVKQGSINRKARLLQVDAISDGNWIDAT